MVGREFRVLAMAAAFAAAPASRSALAQTYQPVSNAAHFEDKTPDLSGIWAHLTCCEFEPPIGGPGPVTNRSRVNGRGNNFQWVGDYSNPILKPAAADVVKQHGNISLRGQPYPTPSNQCRPEGVPYIFWNIGMEILQEPEKVTILYSNDHEVRHVRLNVPHPAHVTPSWYGDSVGHYEGDMLVIDTVGFKVGRFAMVDVYGTPYSEKLHVVERYRLLDHEATKTAQARGQRGVNQLRTSDPGFAPDPGYRGKGLQLEFTVEDDDVFTMGWSATVTYERPISPFGEWPEFVCAENPHRYVPQFLPTAEGADF